MNIPDELRAAVAANDLEAVKRILEAAGTKPPAKPAPKKAVKPPAKKPVKPSAKKAAKSPPQETTPSAASDDAIIRLPDRAPRGPDASGSGEKGRPCQTGPYIKPAGNAFVKLVRKGEAREAVDARVQQKFEPSPRVRRAAKRYDVACDQGCGRRQVVDQSDLRLDFGEDGHGQSYVWTCPRCVVRGGARAE